MLRCMETIGKHPLKAASLPAFGQAQ